MSSNGIKLTRDELKQFLKTHKMIVAFENIQLLAADILPDQVVVLTIAIEDAQGAADSAAASAVAAQVSAEKALEIASGLESGPIIQQQIQEQSDDLTAQISAVRDQLTDLSTLVQSIINGPTP